MSLALIGAGSEPITESRGDCGSHRFVIHIGMVVQPAEPEPEPDRLQAATWHLQGVNGKQQRADAAIESPALIGIFKYQSDAN